MKTINSFRSKFFALGFVFLSVISTYAYDFQLGDLSYTITSDAEPYTVSVARAFQQDIGIPKDTITQVVIPATVTHEDITYSVTSVAGYAFSSCSSLSNVTIPESIVTIGQSAFEGCIFAKDNFINHSSLDAKLYRYWGAIIVDQEIDGLLIRNDTIIDCRTNVTSVVIPNTITAIGKEAFFACRLLSVTIPSSVTSIGDYAFLNCTLPSVTIPTSVTSIGNYAFSMCALSSITIPNSITSISNNVFADCTSLQQVTIPNSVTSIGNCAFQNCTSLSSFTIPGSVSSIGFNAFYNTAFYNNESNWDNGLYKDNCFIEAAVGSSGVYTIKDGTRLIADEAFVYCKLMTSVVIPNSVKVIGKGAFSRISSLESVIIPNGVEFLADRIFSGCTSLTSVTLPESIISIGKNAFNLCTSLTSISLPNSIADIGTYAFSDCKSLAKIAIPDKIKSIQEYTFANCESLTSVCIPNSVTDIKEGAFTRCSALTSITIPSSVTNIDYAAFYWCDALDSVTCYAITPPILHRLAFQNYNATLYVPAESVEAYKTADQWKDFGQILPIEPTSYKSQWCDTWNILYYNQNKTPVAQTWQYTLGQDTIIEGKTYTAVNRHWTIDPENTEEYVASVRFTNNDKVYVYYDNTEYLLYDFNVQVDDSVEVFAGINDYHYAKTYKGRVFDISYSENGAKVYKISVPISTYDDGYVSGGTFREVTWIKGIGNALTGLLIGSATEASNEYIYNLLCAYKGDELMLETDHYWFNIYGCEYNSDSYEPRFFEELQRTECSLHTTGVDSTYLVSCDRFVRYVIKDKLYWWDIYTGSFFRETKDQIILSFPHGGGEECVLYDFSLEIGDTLPVMQYDEKTRGMMFRVVDVSMVTLLDGKKYKKWTLACGYEYIEKIGAINGKGLGNYVAFGPNADAATYLGSPLVCASRNGKILYQMDDAEMERLGAECLCEYNAEQKPEDLFPTLWGLQRTDIEEHTTGDGKPYLSNFEEYVPTQMNGKLYLSDGRNYLREENNQVLFCCPDFEIYEDIVLYDWTLEIGDTLPHNKSTVHAESDFIVKNVSTVTLLDGKKYKKWTLACGYEYIEGIGAINGEGYGHYLCLQSWMQPGTYIRTSLVCASRDGQLLYKMDDAELERLNTECLCDGYQSSYKDQWCDTWNVLYHGWDPEGGDDPYMPYTFIYQLEEDTTINDLTYQRLTGRFSLSTMPSNKEYVAALRFAENKKVFVHYDNTEYLLYDFGAQVGDTLEIFGGIDHYKDFKTLPHVITEIDTLDDGKLQIYSNAIIQESEGYETPFERLYPKIWIEGVGSKDGIVQNSATNRIGIGPCVLLCAYHNDDCIYTTDNPYYTPYGCVHNDSFFTATEEVNAPTQSVQKIMYNNQLLILRDDKTYNVMGVEITK